MSSSPRWYRPPVDAQVRRDAVLLWLHGGGFFRGGLDQDEAHAVATALAGHGVAVVTVDYTLAPVPGFSWLARADGRARHPAAFEDVSEAYRSVRAEGLSVIIGGASAGACLAASAALHGVIAGDPPAGTVLAYGFFHALHQQSDVGQRSRQHRRFTHAAWALNLMNRNYAGSREALDDQTAFPGGHDLSGFPRTIMIDAEYDNMRGSGDRFAQELATSGVQLERHVLTDSSHAFLNRPRSRAFGEAVSLIADWVRREDTRGGASGVTLTT